MPYNTKSLIGDKNNQYIPHQYFNDTSDSFEATKGSNGAIFVLPRGRLTHVSVETSATTTEANSSFSVEFISMIVNDGTDDIKFNFDANTSSAGTITLKPGEVLTDFPRSCSTLYYKAVSGTQPFRAWGVK